MKPLELLYRRRKFYSMSFSIQCIFGLTCHSRTLSNKINRLHESCLRLIDKDKHSTFHMLLKAIIPSLLFIYYCKYYCFTVGFDLSKFFITT